MQGNPIGCSQSRAVIFSGRIAMRRRLPASCVGAESSRTRTNKGRDGRRGNEEGVKGGMARRKKGDGRAVIAYPSEWWDLSRREKGALELTLTAAAP